MQKMRKFFSLKRIVLGAAVAGISGAIGFLLYKRN